MHRERVFSLSQGTFSGAIEVKTGFRKINKSSGDSGERGGILLGNVRGLKQTNVFGEL